MLNGKNNRLLLQHRLISNNLFLYHAEKQEYGRSLDGFVVYDYPVDFNTSILEERATREV